MADTILFMKNIIYTQRELFKYIVLELRTFVLKNRLSSFRYQCSQYLIYTQRELFKYIVLELRTFVLKNRLSSFWYQCSQYFNEMVRGEKLNWVYLTTFW